MAADAGKKTILETMIAMAHKLGLRVIAEGGRRPSSATGSGRPGFRRQRLGAHRMASLVRYVGA